MNKRYIILGLLVSACAHAPMLSSVTILADFEPTIASTCNQQILAGKYQKSNEGMMLCRKDLLLEKAKNIDFAAQPDLEVSMNREVEIARKLDSHSIDKVEFINQIQETECQTSENYKKEYNKYFTLGTRYTLEDVGRMCRTSKNTAYNNDIEEVNKLFFEEIKIDTPASERKLRIEPK